MQEHGFVLEHGSQAQGADDSQGQSGHDHRDASAGGSFVFYRHFDKPQYFA